MQNIWNFWAGKYDKLWVQKYSLKPTRDYIVSALKDINLNKRIKVLDLGCGTGELISELINKFNNIEVTGLDFSEKMLEISINKNPSVKHIKMDAENLGELKDEFDIILCTHSFPYYKEPSKVIKELHRLLSDNGKILIGFASGDSLYDKFILSFVKLTAGSGNYFSDKKFRKIISFYFIVENMKLIREKFFMPKIAVYTLKKVEV